MKRFLVIAFLILSFGFLLTACNNDNKSSQLAEGEVYSCPMHPQIVRHEAGQCPVRNMDLEKRKGTPAELQKLQKGNQQ